MENDHTVFERWQLTGKFLLQRPPEFADDLNASISLYVEKERQISSGSSTWTEKQWFQATISDAIFLGIEPGLNRYARSNL